MLRQVKVQAAAAAVLLAVASGPASAACFELIGCTDSDYFSKSDLKQLSCDALWSVRNTIYNENGYCFKTKRAKKAFDNTDCTVKNAANLHFNSYESTNILRIKSVESQKGC
jgi:hypothetical protein